MMCAILLVAGGYGSDSGDHSTTNPPFYFLGILFWVWIYFLANRKKSDEGSGGGQVGNAIPRATRPNRNADHQTRVRGFPFAGAPCLGRPQTGDDGTLRSLIRARRYREASAQLAPDDLRGRTKLAIARLGPVTDLFRVAIRLKWSRDRRKARTLLAQFNPQLGFRYPRFTWRAYDSVMNRCALLEQRIRQGRFAQAGAGYERLARKYPKADETPDWIMAAALAYGLAGRLDDARRVALRATDLADNHQVAESASRFLRRLEHASKDAIPTIFRTTRPLGPVISEAQVWASDSSTVAEYPRWPNQVGRLAWRHGEAQLSNLDEQTIAAAIDAKATPVVVLTNGPFSFLRAIEVIASDIGVVGLSDGQIFTWEDLVSANEWGQYMMVVRPRATEPTWTVIPEEEAFMGPPLGDGGQRRFDIVALDELRTLAHRFPDDPMIANAFLVCLWGTPIGLEPHSDRTSELLDVASVNRVRFGRYVWARHYWMLVAAGISRNAFDGHLAALDSLGGTKRTATLELALADAEPGARDHHLREAVVFEPFNGRAIGELMEMAERRGDVDEFESLFRYVRKAFPDDPSVTRHERTLLVLRHGPRDTFALVKIKIGEAQEEVAATRVALAAHSADAELLDTAGRELARTRPGDPRVGLCRVFSALHRADADEALSHLDDAIERDGVFYASALALLDIATGLVPSSEAEAILKRGEKWAVTWPQHVRTLVIEARGTHLWKEGLELGRRLARADVSPGWNDITVVEGILQAIERVDPDEREALVREGLRILKRFPKAEGGPLPALMAVALEVHLDPKKAWTLLEATDVSSVPLISFALAADIASRQGDSDRSEAFRSRMANPDLITQGATIAARLGLTRVVEGAVATLDPDLFPHAVYDLFGAGGRVPRLPTVPTPDYPRVSIELLDRLGRAAAWSHLSHLVAVRFRATRMLNFEDGTLGTSLRALARAGEGGPSELEAMAERSSHPAVFRALMVAESAGLGFGGSRERAMQFAPGMVEDLDYIGAES